MYLKLTTIKILFIIYHVNAESCRTPDDVQGECILLKSCPSLLKLTTESTPSSTEFIRKSICGFVSVDPKVCCTTSSSDAKHNPTQQDRKQNNSRHLLSGKRYCGNQHSDDYFHNDNKTVITEFPWLARLIYRDPDDNPDSYEKKYFCLGSLISTKYILTSAICTSNEFILEEVQLGEYHIDNQTDCVQEDSSLEECSDPVETYKVEKVISHAEYNNTSHVNDIGLIRLESEVTYSDYIRPICLPYPGTKLAALDDVLTTSFWGYINSKGDEAIIKNRVLRRLISIEDCIKAYQGYLSASDYYKCTVIADGNAGMSCPYDFGAPVAFSHRLQWHQEGITSFGLRGCDNRYPAVHTRVEKYIDWIEDNIEP